MAHIGCAGSPCFGVLNVRNRRCFSGKVNRVGGQRQSTAARLRSRCASASNEEFDPSCADDEAERMDPESLEDFTKHLDLMWKVSKWRKPEPCACCNGTGQAECCFCHGTGVLTLGDVVYCSMSGCEKCPVCAAKGMVDCKHCNGTGFRAGWMEPGCPVG